METNEEPRFIEIRTTWSGVLPALIAVLRDGDVQGRKMAEDELARMARAADLWNDHATAEEVQI